MKLSEAVELYVARRRSEGAQFNSTASVLRNLCKFCGDIALADLTTERVKTFLNSPLRVATRNGKLSAVRCFAKYYFLRGAMPDLCLEQPMRHRRYRLPSFYTPADIRAILSAIEGCRWQRDEIDSATLRTVLVLLYATGAAVDEALLLRPSSIDICLSQIVFTGTYSMPPRVLPIGDDLRGILAEFLAQNGETVDQDAPLFRYRNGRPINRHHLWQRFRRLHRKAGIKTQSGRPPSLRDLRCTFAVHRLTEWIQNGENLNELLPALSTYMGYASLMKADQFLAFSPERFRDDLCKLSPAIAETHWREQPELLSFLASL